MKLAPVAAEAVSSELIWVGVSVRRLPSTTPKRRGAPPVDGAVGGPVAVVAALAVRGSREVAAPAATANAAPTAAQRRAGRTGPRMVTRDLSAPPLGP